MKERQGLLFTPPPGDPAWEQDAAQDALVAKVVFAEAPYGPYDYLVPERLRTHLTLGCRVRVPLGRGDRLMVGYCVALHPRGADRLRMKSVWSVLDVQTLVRPALLELSQWISESYVCPWGQALAAVLPAGVRDQAGTREMVVWSLAAEVAARWRALALPGKQRRVVEILAAAARPLTTDELTAEAGCTAAPLQTLRRKGLVQADKHRTEALVAPLPKVAREPPLELNPAQARALATITTAIDANVATTILLFGVTGSGKTEVYIQAIEQAVRRGRQAIVLVPEISLTPQTRQRFQSRFADVAVLHSHLSDAQRHAHWQRIARGEVQVVVGARSAVFAPTPRLGLIVIDEEHDSSFKQDTAPRYHARDVARQRARQSGIPLVLGSATPSLESWRRAEAGEYQLVELPERATGQPLPSVETVDLRYERAGLSQVALSRPLERAMQTALSAGGQVILLLNRRGHSTHIQCPACGHVAQCPDCDLPLTLHRQQALAQCHYCDYRIPAPTRCPACRGDGIRFRGWGTERLEEEIQRRFPHHSVLRMDSDTMQRHGSHEQALERFRSGAAQILVGTQMIAKGLDFPNVTLVGVVNADTALHFPDFRAAERTFQLVTQVAGRSGRGPRGGRVLVQTSAPDHPAIVAATQHDFRRFAAEELGSRQAHGFPPWTKLVRLIFRGPQPAQVETWAKELVARLRQAASAAGLTVRILGPAPCPIARVQGRSRFHALLITADDAPLRRLLQAEWQQPPPRDVQWQIDVDPLEML